MLKRSAGFWHNKIFYRKVIVLGRENINPDNHLIFAPNHQNALMDALAVLFTHKGQPVFLARADIFRRKLTASILYFLKILPVYRMRDGFSSLKSNDQIFEKTIDILKNKNGLVILPEGDHAGYRRLRQLKKGICRVAFHADEATGFSLGIKIIPVGIEFSNYSRFRQVLTVVYGKPIEIAEYHDLYRENPEKALLELRNKLSKEIKNLMVHIESTEDYEAIDELRSIVNGRFSDDIKRPKLFRDRTLIEKMNRLKELNPSVYERICNLSIIVKKKAEDLKTSYRLLEKKKHSLGWLISGMAGLFLTLPLFLFGNIFTLTFIRLPEFRVRKIQDIQFHGSFRYVLSLALAFVFLPIYLIISLIIFKPLWLGLAIFTTIPLAGIFSWNYNILYRRIIGGFRVRNYLNSGNENYSRLKNSYDELIRLVNSL